MACERASQGTGAGNVTQDPGIDRLEVAEKLTRVIDPEVGMNIVDLGLVYDLEIDGEVVVVRLTMTTPACPMSSYIRQEAGKALRGISGLRRIETELVWEPAWSPRMIDPEASVRRFGVRYRGG